MRETGDEEKDGNTFLTAGFAKEANNIQPVLLMRGYSAQLVSSLRRPNLQPTFLWKNRLIYIDGIYMGIGVRIAGSV